MDRNTYLGRVGRMQGELKRQGVDLALFADREDLIYYTGMTNFDCLSMVMPAEGEPRLVCLWLDAEYVRSMVPSKQVVPYVFPATTIGATTADVIREMGYAAPRIGVGKYFVEFSVYDALRKALPHDAIVVTGSFNFTKAAEQQNAENLLVIRSQELATQYARNWESHAVHAELYGGRGR